MYKLSKKSGAESTLQKVHNEDYEYKQLKLTFI